MLKKNRRKLLLLTSQQIRLNQLKSTNEYQSIQLVVTEQTSAPRLLYFFNAHQEKTRIVSTSKLFLIERSDFAE